MPRALPPIDALYDEAPCGLLVTALDGTILKVNRTFCDWVGRTPEALIEQVRLQDLFSMGGRIFHQTHWVPILQMQGSLAEVKFEVCHVSGRTIPMILNARRRGRAEGAFDEVTAFVAEDRNRYERELMNARKKADALVEQERETQLLLRDRTLFAEQMVGIVSHDLRNPLSAILMGIQLLERVGEGDRRNRVLSHVRQSAERAQHLIEDLLDFTQARLGTGLRVNRQAVDLHQVAANAVEELALAHPGQQIVHGIHGPGACEADEARLVQLIVNLVRNAASYGRQGTQTRVDSRVEGEVALLSVHNEGEPIEPQMLATIFDPMVRGAPAAGSARSVGLGLFIVREIARAHGGEMQVRSLPGEGTTFTLRFPVVAARAA